MSEPIIVQFKDARYGVRVTDISGVYKFLDLVNADGFYTKECFSTKEYIYRSTDISRCQIALIQYGEKQEYLADFGEPV